MKKFSLHEKREMAALAADCAERVLPFFESAYPLDERPRNALNVCRRWIDTGYFSMDEIRGASLGAHAAARETVSNIPASFAARAAGQAVATAHVPQHAYGGAYYALKAIAAAYPANTLKAVQAEYEWQSCQLTEDLREEMMKRIVIRRSPKGVTIIIDKTGDF